VTLFLDADAEATIEAEARTRRLVETGGPLFGFISDDDEAVVARAYGPGPKAKHRPRSYVPDSQETQRLIDSHYDNDGLSYLGEWHTHPQGQATPSGRDANFLSNLAEDAAAGTPEPVALILATRIFHFRVQAEELGAFQLHSAGRIERLEISVVAPADMEQALDIG